MLAEEFFGPGEFRCSHNFGIETACCFLTCSYGLLGGHDGVGKQDEVPAAGATDLILHLLLFWFVSKIPKVYLLYSS